MNWLFLSLYLIFQLLIGFWASKKIRTETDYLLAGRNLPHWMISLSLFASWFGAETCIGSSAAVYESGLSGSRSDPFGYSICLFLMGFLLAARLWKGNYVTLSDFYRERYGSTIEKLAVWIIVPSSLIWGAAQVRAFGQVLSATTELDVNMAITISAIFVVAYTFLGGLLGDIMTDVVQGVIIAFTLVAVLVICVIDIGSIDGIFSQMDAVRLSLIAPGESLLERMDRWMVPILGSLVTQELIARVFAAKNASVARSACFTSAITYLVLGSIPVFLGLIGPWVLPNVEDSEQFLILLAREKLSPVMFIMLSGALISAILATIDSILLAISALVSHNFVVPAFRITDEKMKLKLARFFVVVAALICYVTALYSDGIYELAEAASSFGTAGILVITLMGLFTPWREPLAAGAALAIGLILTPLANYVFEWPAPFLTTIIGSLLGFGFFQAVGFVFLKKSSEDSDMRSDSLPSESRI